MDVIIVLVIAMFAGVQVMSAELGVEASTANVSAASDTAIFMMFLV